MYTEAVNTVISSRKEEMIDTLKRWINVPSIKSAPLPGAPFGPEIRKMLDIAMEDCSRLGFKTEIFDGYAGHADLGEGDDKDALGILAHIYPGIPHRIGLNYNSVQTAYGSEWRYIPPDRF